MADDDIFRRIMEVAPNEKGEGMKIVLSWDGDKRAIAQSEFQGQVLTADLDNATLRRDIHKLTEQACNGELQVAFRDEGLIALLETADG